MPLGGIECCTLFGNMTSVAGPHCLNPSRLPFVTYQSSYMRFVPECDCSLAAGCLTHHQVQRICQVTLLCDRRHCVSLRNNFFDILTAVLHGSCCVSHALCVVG